ncbi:MAG: hypothetical protein ACREGF_05365, partial [Candidatus Saccharimonadales bacterium]
HLRSSLAWGSLAILAIASLLLVRLGSEPGHFTAAEIAARHLSSSLGAIFNDPLNAPFSLPQHFLVAISPHSLFLSRLPAAFYGGLTLLILYAILRFWQGRLVATLETVLLATSSWFLHITETGTSEVLLFGIVPLVGCALLLKHTLRRSLAFALGLVVVASLLYVPGMIWLIWLGVIWRAQSIVRNLKHIDRRLIVAGIIIFLIVIAPLIRACYYQPSLILDVFGLPAKLPSAITVIHNAANIPLQLFIRTPTSNPFTWVGRLPALDIFTDVMFVLGLYLIWKHRELDRSKLVGGSILGAAALIILGDPVGFTSLLPLVYLVVAGGIGYMSDRWLRVFPNNPLARTAGISLLTVAVIVSANFQLKRYFVALPYALRLPPTIQQEPQVSATIKS